MTTTESIREFASVAHRIPGWPQGSGVIAMGFFVGQRLECIDDGWFHASIDVRTIDLPKKDRIYRCAGYDKRRDPHSRENCQYIHLEGFGDTSFADDHFRPIIERSTDISIFERMLIPSDRKIKEGV